MIIAGRKWSRTAVALALVAAILCAAVIYSRAVRRVALGDQFQYIPREAELIIATGDVESLWTGVEGLFGHVLEPGGLFEDVGNTLRKEKPPVGSVADLRRFGIDTRRGVLLSIYRPTTDTDFVAVVPIVDPDVTLKSLQQFFQPKDDETFKITDRLRREYVIHQFGDHFFGAFPERGIAVAASSKDLMLRSLTLRSENLAHASNNDALYHAVRHVARGPLLVGPNVFVYWQSRTAPFDERSGVLRLSQNEIRIDGEIELTGGTLSVVDNLRRRGNDTKWLDNLPDQTVGVAVLQDEQLASYRNFLGEEVISGAFPKLRRWAPNVELPRLQRVAVAITDYQDGLPDFLVGFWGDRKQLETMRAQMQQAYRKSRDLRLLTGAIAKYRQNGGAPPSLTDLERLHLLQPEPYSLFHRYPILHGKIGDPEFGPQDFANAVYERNLQGHRIRFLAPPLGQNDLAYRPDLAKADATALHNDRYRMATVFYEGVLWIATDVHDIETLLTPRAKRTVGTRGPALAPPERGTKFHAALDIDRLMNLALLSPGSDLEKLFRDASPTLHGFSLLQLDAVPSLAEDRLRFSATLRRGTEK